MYDLLYLCALPKSYREWGGEEERRGRRGGEGGGEGGEREQEREGRGRVRGGGGKVRVRRGLYLTELRKCEQIIGAEELSYLIFLSSALVCCRNVEIIT